MLTIAKTKTYRSGSSLIISMFKLKNALWAQLVIHDSYLRPAVAKLKAQHNNTS